jgi:hypothetical protein
MDPDTPSPRSRGRETLINIMLALVLGGSFIFFLNLVTFGIVLHVITVLVSIALIGYVHYVLWGQALSDQVAGEREEQRIKDQLEAMRDDDEPFPHGRD